MSGQRTDVYSATAISIQVPRRINLLRQQYALPKPIVILFEILQSYRISVMTTYNTIFSHKMIMKRVSGAFRICVQWPTYELTTKRARLPLRLMLTLRTDSLNAHLLHISMVSASHYSCILF